MVSERRGLTEIYRCFAAVGQLRRQISSLESQVVHAGTSGNGYVDAPLLLCWLCATCLYDAAR
jgi:hypothetical protein